MAFHLFLSMKKQGARAVSGQSRALFAEVIRTPPHRYRRAALAVLAYYAIESGDREMAESVTELLAPWAGEHLGLWPLDLVIGPADEPLEALHAVG